MSRRLPSLKALRAFEAAARHLSFSRAADELHVTQGAISRQVKALEAELGVELFRRRNRAVELTEYGREYLPVARDAFDKLAMATTRLKDAARRDVLTVNVLPTFAMRWLIPRLPNFMALNPDIEMRMVTSIRPVDFEREEVDIAVRVGTVPDSPLGGIAPRIDLQMVQEWKDVRAQRFCPDVLLAVCSPGYLGKRTTPIVPTDLLEHELLHTSTRSRAWVDWFRAYGIDFDDQDISHTFGHFFMGIQAATDGLGIALVPRILVEDSLKRRELQVLFEAPAESSGAYYLLSREDLWDVDRVHRFREWILEQRRIEDTG